MNTLFRLIGSLYFTSTAVNISVWMNNYVLADNKSKIHFVEQMNFEECVSIFRGTFIWYSLFVDLYKKYIFEQLQKIMVMLDMFGKIIYSLHLPIYMIL